MSWRTKCNYCSYQNIKNDALKEGKIVTKIDRKGWPAIYVHPKEVPTEEATLDEEDGEPSKYFVAMIVELPEHCCC